MSDLRCNSESEVKDILLQLALETDEAPFVFVAFREQSVRSLQRSVTFVIQTKEGNETLVNKVIAASTQHDDIDFKFIKSDVNIQDGNFAVDYLYVLATIIPKLT